MSTSHIGMHLFLQLAVIIATCRVVGWIGRRWLGQTQVFMEMVAGVLLGPSLLGWLLPDVQTWLFPKTLSLADGVTTTHPNMVVLYALAQVGLVLYMFVIGLEFDLSLLRGRVKRAGLVSSAGIAVPFLVGTALLPFLMARDDLFAHNVTLGVACLFVGASISITAFPMLARILFERGISSTHLGALTLAAGSIDDAVAWCLLALVLALFQQNPEAVLLTVGGGLVYGVLLLTLGRRVLRRFQSVFERDGELGVELFTAVIIVLMVCAWVTDSIGIHAVFGAFICGVAMPKGALAEALTHRIEQLTTSLFVPVFFAYSGLNTKIGLVDSWQLWAVAAVVIVVSILGKGVACTLAARLGGESWRHSAIIGALMNARGMMELVLLNIGLDRGVISPTFFTILVIMAIVTTGMASPLYNWLSRDLELEGARVPGTRRSLVPGELTPGMPPARIADVID